MYSSCCVLNVYYFIPFAFYDANICGAPLKLCLSLYFLWFSDNPTKMNVEMKNQLVQNASHYTALSLDIFTSVVGKLVSYFFPRFRSSLVPEAYEYKTGFVCTHVVWFLIFLSPSSSRSFFPFRKGVEAFRQILWYFRAESNTWWHKGHQSHVLKPSVNPRSDLMELQRSSHWNTCWNIKVSFSASNTFLPFL